MRGFRVRLSLKKWPKLLARYPGCQRVFSCCLRRKLIVSSGKKNSLVTADTNLTSFPARHDGGFRIKQQENKNPLAPPRVLARRTRAKTSGTRGKAAVKAGQGWCYRSVTAALHSEMSFNFKYSHC